MKKLGVPYQMTDGIAKKISRSLKVFHKNARNTADKERVIYKKLTISKVLEIRKDFIKSNLNANKLSIKYGVHRGTMCKILLGKIWKYISGDKYLSVCKKIYKSRRWAGVQH